MLTYASMMLLVCVHFFTQPRDPNHRAIGCLSGLLAAGMLTAGVTRILQAPPRPESSGHLRQAAWEMFLDRPIFGWGVDSFGPLLPFYGSDFLLTDSYERSGCDALQLLAELGIVGMIPSIALVVFFVVHYLRGRHNIQFTNHLLIGLFAIGVLAFLDSPLMSPAVFYSFFSLLFIALRWADVTRKRADEVDAPRPTLVTPQSLRRVPFFTTTGKNESNYL